MDILRFFRRRPESAPPKLGRKAPKFCPGYKSGIVEALGLGDLRVRSLTLHNPASGPVTATVEVVVTTEQAERLVRHIEERKFYLAAADAPRLSQEPSP